MSPSALTPDDLEPTITIRSEPMSVVQAVCRTLAHVVYHTGQIVLLARHYTGDARRPLTIAPGESVEYDAAMGQKYGDWWLHTNRSGLSGPRFAPVNRTEVS